MYLILIILLILVLLGGVPYGYTRWGLTAAAASGSWGSF